MKALTTAIMLFCTLNMLVLLGGGAWLTASGRLDGARVESMLDLFRETTAERDAREAEAALVSQQQAEAEAEAERAATPPLTAEQWTDRKLENDEILNERARRLRREIEDLRRAIGAERGTFDREVTEFESRRQAWDAMRKRVQEAEEDAQFQTALETLRKLPPESGAAMLREIDATGGREIVVTYLNALDIRIRTKIFEEFEGDDAAMAADLLERLRTLGLDARADAGNPG